MKNSINYFISSLALLFSLAANAQYSENTFMVSFEPGTTQQEIDQALDDLNSIELAITPITEVRLWKVISFPFPYPPTGEMIIDINDTDKKSRLRSETNGGGLNYIPEEINGPPVSPNLKDAQLDCQGSLATYIANDINSVSIGVFDTGLNYFTEPEYQDYFFDLAGFNQWDHLNNDPIADDTNGHGSHMASIVSHTINKSYGLNESSTAPLEYYEIRKCFDDAGSGFMFEIIDALEQSALNGMNIASCSWSFLTNSRDAYDSPLYATLSVLGSDYDVLIVAAAGNDGANLNPPIAPGPTTPPMKYYPAGYNLPNILTATTFDCNDDLASFANYGIKDIDIALPGIGLAGLESDNIIYRSGTSQSTALLAGIAASLGTHLDEFHYQPIICAIMDAAEPRPNLLNKVKSGGIVDAHAALAILENCEGVMEPKKANSQIEENSKGVNKIFPNPAKDQVTVDYYSKFEASLTIHLSDVHGRIVLTKEFDVMVGDNTLFFPIDHMDSGFYNLTLKNSTNLESYKIIIEK